MVTLGTELQRGRDLIAIEPVRYGERLRFDAIVDAATATTYMRTGRGATAASIVELARPAAQAET